MKSVFDKEVRDEFIFRISLLDSSSRPEWGKMSVYQMLKHCTLCEEMFLGKTKYRRVFIGRVFGRLGLRNMLKDDRPLQHNAPTHSKVKVQASTGDMANEKLKWITLMKEYENYSTENFNHWFFGKMTREQVGYFVYKHDDHHLRQFGK